MRVVMVSGRAGEGKTTFSNLCVQILSEHDIMSDVVSFANGVKNTAYEMGWDGEKDKKGRRLLQQIGNAGREYDENLWARQTVENIQHDELANAFDVDFIDDWRFMNEGTKVILDAYPTALKVRIIRPKEFHTLYGSELYNDPSETGLPEASNAESVHFYDYLVYNLDGLDGLREEANDFIRKHLLTTLQEA